MKNTTLKKQTDLNQGTPKSLNQAIRNGVKQSFQYGMDDGDGPHTIELHVKDYLSQKFATALLKASSGEVSAETALVELWSKISSGQ